MYRKKIASVCFFNAYPPQSGSGTVCSDFFDCLPFKDKKLFQFSKNLTKNKKVINVKPIKNNALFKLLCLPNLILRVLLYLKNSSNNYLIVEGPSWSFYSFIVILLIKIFYDKVKIIYRSHSIEWEIRKNNSNYLIQKLTKYFEHSICKISNVVTSVSKIEQKKFIKIYKKKTYLFPNSISLRKLKKINETKINFLKKNSFIFFCGSYDYGPNKYAINHIIEKIIPKINKKIKLIITGDSNYDFKNNRVINLKLVSKAKLKFLYKNCIALVAPITEGYGTRIKFIEAMYFNCRIITTPLGFEGLISSKKNKNIKIEKNINNFYRQVAYFQNNNKKYNNYVFNKNLSMEFNMKNFIKLFIA